MENDLQSVTIAVAILSDEYCLRGFGIGNDLQSVRIALEH